MKPGDLVRIDIQPRNQIVDLVGERGYIEEVRGDVAQIQTIANTGRGKGNGAVPLDCLAFENDPAWVRAKELHDLMQKQFEERIEKEQKRWQEKVREVAKAFDLSIETVQAIYHQLSRDRSL